MMKKIILFAFALALVSISAETISVSKAICVPITSREALEKRLGFAPVSMIRGQVEIGQLGTIYSSQECVKAIKGSNVTATFSCEIEKKIGTDREKAGIVRKTYKGSCF